MKSKLVDSIEIWANYTWDCPVCDYTNFVVGNLKKVQCKKCSREYNVDRYIGNIIIGNKLSLKEDSHSSNHGCKNKEVNRT